MTNKYFLIDAIKVVLAVMVVGLHTLPFFNIEKVDNLLYSLFDIAVPLFFALSGFFFERKQKLGSSLKRIVILYAFWFVFCWPLMFPHFRGLDALQCVQRVLFSNTYGVSWYLVALMWCMAIVTYMHKIRGGMHSVHYYPSRSTLCASAKWVGMGSLRIHGLFH